MPQAKALEGQSPPCIDLRRFVQKRPKMLVSPDAVAQKAKVESRERVDELVNGVLLDSPNHGIAAQESACAEFFQAAGCILPGATGNRGKDFLPGHSRLPVAKGFNNREMARWAFEKRGKKPVVLSSHFVRFAEEQPVKILRGAHSGTKKTPVVGDTAERHIAFGYLPTVH